MPLSTGALMMSLSAMASAPDMTVLGPFEHPAAIHIASPCAAQGLSISAGLADADTGRPLTTATPVRVASITKTFTAATILRLWEQDLLSLDQAIGPLISPDLAALLLGAGYPLDQITVRQLLNHTAGVYDHGADSRYHQLWTERPNHQWTRHEQVALSVQWSGPRHAPGTRFAYSDTGYLLLGDIIERITGLSLAAAVRQQLALDSAGLNDSWWEVAEASPPHASHPARQFWKGYEVNRMHASLDTYGGGGLLMSARDLTRFFLRLVQNGVFEKPETLAEMLRPAAHEGGDHYRLGIMSLPNADAQGNTAYWHSGFWGTVVYAVPETGVAIAGITTEQSAYPALNQSVQTLLKTYDCNG